jgi:hypothetical protein
MTDTRLRLAQDDGFRHSDLAEESLLALGTRNQGILRQAQDDEFRHSDLAEESLCIHVPCSVFRFSDLKILILNFFENCKIENCKIITPSTSAHGTKGSFDSLSLALRRQKKTHLRQQRKKLLFSHYNPRCNHQT